MVARFPVVLALLLSALFLASCGSSGGSNAPPGPGQTLNIISGSENQTLEPIVQRFAKQHHAAIHFSYEGSLDIKLALQDGARGVDAVWPANSLWISLGDTHHLVKDQESIMRSPVVFGVKKSVARRLGWIGKPVRVEDILNVAEAGKLRFMMTSATQSNSGASAYMGYLYAFAGDPEVLTAADLQRPEVRGKIKRLLGTVNRTSASSGFLETLFLKNYDFYDAMVNYEALIIEANQQLVKEGKEPLYAVYPTDGLSIADSPLGFVDHGNKAKHRLFTQLQTYLLKPRIQKEIQHLGRRAGLLGLDSGSVDKSVFNPAWGIDVSRVINPIRFPRPAVIEEALNLYQSAFRKPSFTIFCLDFSGSMAGDRVESLKNAMTILLDQNAARRYLLQAAPGDTTVAIPFNDRPIAEWTVNGNNPAGLRGLLRKIDAQDANGGTDIYTPVIRALQIFKQRGIGERFPAVILMTDGESNTGATFGDLQAAISQAGLGKVPVYAIRFGDASPSQLNEIVNATSGSLFDGRANLVNAFRAAKGYN